MSAHTPGPWAVEWRYGLLMVFGGEDRTDFVAEVTESNARLIAKAPEMLAILKAMQPALTLGVTNELIATGMDYTEAYEFPARVGLLIAEIEGEK